jgi:hypothetical protein
MTIEVVRAGWGLMADASEIFFNHHDHNDDCSATSTMAAATTTKRRRDRRHQYNEGARQGRSKAGQREIVLTDNSDTPH